MMLTGLFFLLLMAMVGLALIVFWVSILIEVVTREPAEGNTKLMWVLILIFTHFIGALIYLLIRRPQRIQETGQ